MGEILDFNPEDRTALGRFLLAADRQEQEATAERHTRKARQKPAAEQSIRAKRELNFLFYGANKEDAERLYNQGLSDIVHQRQATTEQVAFGLGTEILILVESTARNNYTPAAIFYTHVQSLTETANRIYDQQPVQGPNLSGAVDRDWGYRPPDQESPTSE